MQTLTLHEAASFLKMHPEEVRRRAKSGLLPGAKAGRSWVFIDVDLADWLRSLYALPRQALQVAFRKELEPCHFSNAVTPGGSTLSRQTASEYADLLGLKQKPLRKSFTTT
ncbi:helix-turn-helix domain-containing protein [Dechloromonas sp. ARDL1]|uniref:helix-turn-helix domain-containing protein n=1 Tax=Dechloromonas sp. ARDL1 TaxID=3322121 RepID=UPI003DA74A2A